MDQAVRYAQHLISKGQNIICERRIVPMEVDIPRPYRYAYDVSITDWNIRVLTTLDTSHSTIIDAEIRFSEIGKPVNIHQGAEASRIHGVLSKNIRAKVYSLAKKATQILCNESGIGKISAAIGVAGLDIMVDRNGQPHVIEANAGMVGGFGTLSKIDRAPLKTTKKLVQAAVSALEGNKKDEVELGERGKLERLPILPDDEFDIFLLNILAHNVNLVDAEASLREHDLDSIWGYLKVGLAYRDIKKYDNALYFMEKVCSMAPEEANSHMFRALILREMGRVDDAKEVIDRLMEVEFSNEFVMKEKIALLLIEDRLEEAKILLSNFFQDGGYRAEVIDTQVIFYLRYVYAMLGNKQKFDEITASLRRDKVKSRYYQERRRAVKQEEFTLPSSSLQ